MPDGKPINNKSNCPGSRGTVDKTESIGDESVGVTIRDRNVNLNQPHTPLPRK